MGQGKKHTPEQIVSLLRQIEVAVANGKTTPAACREWMQGAELPIESVAKWSGRQDQE